MLADQETDNWIKILTFLFKFMDIFSKISDSLQKNSDLKTLLSSNHKNHLETVTVSNSKHMPGAKSFTET